MRTIGWFLCLVVLVPHAATGPVEAAECGEGVRCRCGDVVSGGYRLDADLGPCPADGLRLRGDAALDCQGHVIRGTGGQGPVGVRVSTVGIVLDRTLGAAVYDCGVTGFGTGIELRHAERSTVVGSTVFHNGDSRARVGYGIHFNRSQNNTVRDCTVYGSADEGIHVGRGSDGNTLVANSVHDNGRENLYVLEARGTRLLHNRVRGKVSAALYMKHATASYVEANRFDDRPVVVRGRSSENVFVDNRFTGGLRFQAYRSKGEKPAIPSGNIVRGGRLGGAGSCLSFVDAHENRIETVTVEECKRISAYSEYPTTNRFVGVSLERIPLDLSGGATLRLLGRLRVDVLDPGGAPVPRVRFEVRDRMGRTFEGPPTDASGRVELTVPTHVVSAGSLQALTPVRLHLKAEGYAALDTVLEDPLPPSLRLTLEPEG